MVRCRYYRLASDGSNFGEVIRYHYRGVLCFYSALLQYYHQLHLCGEAVILEKLTVLQLVKNISAFYAIQRFITAVTRAPTLTFLS
jgi:hypothetical protein